jgi:hypothetical protein
MVKYVSSSKTQHMNIIINSNLSRSRPKTAAIRSSGYNQPPNVRPINHHRGVSLQEQRLWSPPEHENVRSSGYADAPISRPKLHHNYRAMPKGAFPMDPAVKGNVYFALSCLKLIKLNSYNVICSGKEKNSK